MDKDHPHNIFDSAGKSKKTPPSSQPDSFSKKDPSEKQLNLNRDPEINEMLNQMIHMQEDIQNKLFEAYDQSGISANQIKNFLNNPSNFPPEIWQKIQNQRDQLEKRLGDVLKSYAKKPKTGHITKITSEESKERKSKTLGARKKWIPM